MIRARISEHKLARSLQRLEHLDALSGEICGRYHGSHIEQDVGILLKHERALLLDNSIEFLTIVFRHSVPQLGLAIMRIIDRW